MASRAVLVSFAGAMAPLGKRVHLDQPMVMS
jgi:hypothetical protein